MSDYNSSYTGSQIDTAVGYSLDYLSSIVAFTETKSETAVDVFVYDTSLDTDGGAWRHRCQHTSWYNETLNTTVRGSRREFPAVAVIVAESNKITIYDGDDSSLPLWMRFVSSSGAIVGGNSLTGISMKNGVMAVSDSGLGAQVVSFLEDTCYRYRHGAPSYMGKYTLPLSGRNIIGGSGNWDGDSSYQIANQACYDIAMTGLPDAPVDPATGLPVPTIAVATDGNSTYSTSIITDSGDVYDIASDSTGTAASVDFDSVSLSVVRSDGTVYVWDNAGSITADGVSPDATYSASSTPALLGTVSKVAA